MKGYEMLLYYWVFLPLSLRKYTTICKSPYWFLGNAKKTQLELENKQLTTT
jgi:hypothetical protein